MTTITGGNTGGCHTVFVTAEWKEQQTEKQESEWIQAGYLEVSFFPGRGTGAMLYIGCGEETLTDIHTAMELCATACREWKKRGVTEFSLEVTPFLNSDPDLLMAAAESCFLALADPRSYKSIPPKQRDFTVILPEMPKEGEQQIEKARVLAEAVLAARDLVNMPANYLRPEDLVQQIGSLAAGTEIETEIFDEDRLRREGFGGIIAVGEGSAYPPYMLVMRYLPNPEDTEVTGLAGKGVTVDTGGYCIKASGSQGGIRGDMAGAAAAAGAVCALAKLKSRKNVIAVIPICENKISGNSMLVGDVITSYSGRTIEVCNTDAEGRIILADAVSYAVRQEHVTRVLDIATLTGAAASVFGNTITAVLSDNDALWEEFRQAAGKTAEQYWRLPFGRVQERMIDSSIADIKNSSSCGTITAGLFIRRFADRIPWIHLDIAGTAWAGETVAAYQESLATGVGINAIYQWLIA